MNRAGLTLIVGAFFSLSAAAQDTGAQAGAQASTQTSAQEGATQAQPSGNPPVALSSGTAFNAELNSALDSRKAKAGDSVTARTTEAVKSDGKTVIPRGTKVVGHVTQASARAKGESESALGVVFDKAVLKNGHEIPLNAGIQALASAQSSASAAGADTESMAGMGASAAGSGAAGGRGALGGVTSSAGGAVGSVTNTAANAGAVAGGAVNSTANATGNVASGATRAVGGLNAAGQFTSNSQGVFGLNGLNLNSSASNGTQGSVITSTGKNVHLDSGTRMLLVSQSQAGGPGASKQPASNKPEPKSERRRESSQPNKQ